MHTILGAKGIIAQELSRALAARVTHIRQVSRNPRKVNEADETFPADLLDGEATAKAVAGSDVAYLVAGLKYDASVWQEQWPRVMRNVIDACKQHHAPCLLRQRLRLWPRGWRDDRGDDVQPDEQEG